MDITNNTVPKAGIFSKGKDIFSYIFQAFRAIRRNKRRSLSMVAGLILGIAILSGISLYSTVLMSDVYDSVIAGTPYEIRMDFKGSLSDSAMDEYIQHFRQNTKISDVQTLFGNYKGTYQNTQGPMAYDGIIRRLKADIHVEYANESHNSEGRIFDRDFYDSEIGSRFRDTLLTEKDPQIYDNNSVYEQGIFINEGIATIAKLKQGNVIPSIDLTLLESEGRDANLRTKIISTVTLENIIIAGIFFDDDVASGLSMGNMVDESSEIYLPQELFGSNESFFLNDLQNNEMRYAIIKIDESQFSIADPTLVSSQINSLINEFEKENSDYVGINLVANKLAPYSIISIFIFLFDAILTIPVAILSLYLLSFGIDLSLFERKYQVGILKTQGASPSQIKRKILTEALILAMFGLVVGYLIAIFGAWAIGTATGFMKWDWTSAVEELSGYFVLDFVAFFIIGGIIVIFLVITVLNKSNSFIQLEIAEIVRKSEEEKDGFLKRTNLDVVFFIIGLIALISVYLLDNGVKLNIGYFESILVICGPVLFWIGGAAIVARLAVWIPGKTDPIVRRIGFLKDISVLIKGNVFRKSGDIPRLALIIALTVSFSMLAVVHGTTEEVHGERLITWSVGSDLYVTTDTNFSLTSLTNIRDSNPSIQGVMAKVSMSGMILNDPVPIFSVDTDIYATIGLWQSDAIPGNGQVEDLLVKVSENPLTGCIIGKSLMSEQALSIGEIISINFLTYYWNGSVLNYDYLTRNITIQGKFDHTPGLIGGNSVIIDHRLVNNMNNFTGLAEVIDTLPIQTIPAVFQQYMNGFSGDNNKEILASDFLVRTEIDAVIDPIMADLLSTENSWIISVKSLEGEIQRADNVQNMDFGIP